MFCEPHGIICGRNEIARIASVIRATHPDFQYFVIVGPEELLGTAGRIQWVSGRSGVPPEYAGTDVIVARDGVIAEVHLFFDALPGDNH
ncbi:hypothetical protein [Rhizobium sp. 2YAF20]|uniref:hypothetical protein n=1 Tax=Rhizobium sp. 2YAF20 TaxID=3233027 RepID=UPI003F9BAD4D